MLTELAFDSGVRFGLDLASGRHEFHEAIRAELRERLKSDSCVERLVGEWLSDERRTSDSLEDLLWRPARNATCEVSGRELNQKALTDLANTFDAKMLAGAYELAAIADDARLDAVAATGELRSIMRSRGRIDCASRRKLVRLRIRSHLRSKERTPREK